MSRVVFSALNLKEVAKHVGVGMCAASFWRGAWYLCDDHVFPDEPGKSAGACLVGGALGMTASQGLIKRAESMKAPMTRQMARFGSIYTIALSCVLVWRGTWMFWDLLYERFHNDVVKKSKHHSTVSSTDPGHLTHSGLLSHGLATAALLACGLFASVLAPPAAACVIRDLTIKAGQKPYAGPAAQVSKAFLGRGGRPTPQTTPLVRSIHTKSHKAGSGS
eukprot:CAMPEP_0194048290 /NCGR_PEP_ID=MMETSP0009_2-20130614/26834_1 /TAXON_ID=210454 /ORGANISM="Grammatophora oceanica, Strain CCMP 410" /LENGTH=219 /DNA_ID=CAMNT_0038694119 /DNA_START=65 /DNA_END=724 /DNA_ORIENTATION=-